jgi:hypothetical protein
MTPSKNDDHAKSSPSPAKSPTKNVSPTTNIDKKEEVFNIGNNLYTYEDAQSICTAYGARLATYDDMEKSYQDGGEWCNYGWSDGQMIFYPTQKDTWQKLQKDPKTKHNCGRPGINGGFMANPYVKFGVNCYGMKPKPKDIDKDMMKRKLISQTGTEASSEQIDPNVQKWKSMLNTLTINSYNNKEWSEYDKNIPMSIPTLVPISNFIQPSTPSPVSNASPAFISAYLPSPAPTPMSVRSPTGV